MIATSFVVAASSIFALTHGAPIAVSTKASLVERASAKSYAVFGGDGSTSAGWPSQSNWMSFSDLWDINVGTIGVSCSQFGQPENSDSETAAIKSALQSTATKANLPAEFLLAIMMQESKGCARVPTTNYGVNNPGLMQDHDGKASCSGAAAGQCSSSTITTMIEEGAGINNEFGLQQTVGMATGSGAQKYYQGARIYNSGSMDTSGNLGAGIATHCYASDIANRLRGWSGEGSTCSETAIGGMTGSTGNVGNDDNDDNEEPESPAPTTTSTPTKPSSTPTPTPTPSAQPSTTPSTGNANNGNGNSLITTTATAANGAAPGASTSCKGYYTVVANDTCETVTQKTNVSFNTLKSLNLQLDSNCSNLWKDYSYCVA